jgi:hypothetical protein
MITALILIAFTLAFMATLDAITRWEGRRNTRPAAVGQIISADCQCDSCQNWL